MRSLPVPGEMLNYRQPRASLPAFSKYFLKDKLRPDFSETQRVPRTKFTITSSSSFVFFRERRLRVSSGETFHREFESNVFVSFRSKETAPALDKCTKVAARFIMQYRGISRVFNSWVSGEETISLLFFGLKYRLSGPSRNCCSLAKVRRTLTEEQSNLWQRGASSLSLSLFLR